MSTAQNLRDAAVSFPMNYLSDLDLTIIWCCFGPDETWPDDEKSPTDDDTLRTFMLIAACALEGGWIKD